MFAVMVLAPVLYLAFFAATPPLPPGKGKAIVQRSCKGCHALKVVTRKRATKEQWKVLVDQMITRGAEVEDEEFDTLLAYLSRNFGPMKNPSGATKAHSGIHP
jgi:mono/diheme cytochrome c family protein